MLDPQASRFWQATLHSGLMDVEGLTVCWNAIPPAKREAPEHIDRRLARQAVQSKGLTLWQAQQLLAGRTSGFKVDRYVLLDMIGQGGMGRVYLARDTRLNRRVALKILSPERINNPRAIARFQREARVGAQLQHENLVRIYDFGESNGRYFLVMEYIEGKTIGTLISEQGPMPSATAVRLLRQVALGLEHAHRKGLIHRDVNPYNILVTHDGTAKLADLGLALDLAEEDRVTREGATVGTFDYVAPEQARQSHSADIRSDIYSLGCTLYHMLSGQVPFPSPSLPEKLFSHQALEPAPLDQLIPDLPEGLMEVVQRMMRKSPDERYATPMQVAQALEPYGDDYAGVGNREGAAPVLQNPRAEPTPRSPVPLSDDTVPRLEAESAPALVKTVAATVSSKSPAGTATESGSRFDAADPTAPLLSPVNDFDETEAKVPLDLDLGPAVLLSERTSGSKSRSVSDHSASAADGVVLPAWLPRQWLWGLVALTVTVMVLVVIMAVANPFGATPGRHPTGPPSPPDQTTKSHPKSAQAIDTGADQPKPAPEAEPAILVRTNGEEGKGIPYNNLLDAMEKAMGSRGWVELRNREPLRLASDQIFDLRSSQGSLIIRAATGIEPVIEIELKGSKPLLEAGSGVKLILSGLTIVVRYLPAGAASSSTPPAVITTAGRANINHCAFKVVGSSYLKDSRAIYSNGGALEVDHCWFEGFDKAIEFSTVNRTPARIQQTMIVPAPGQAQGQPAELYGWGVKIESVGSGSTQPHLILEHCTVEGAGLLDLTSRRVLLPLQVEVNHCAVRAEALLACKPSKPGESPGEQFHWLGNGNQYDIRGRSWIVLSATEGNPAFSTGVIDLGSWLLSVANKDNNPIQAKLTYQTDPNSRSNPLRPRDFTIEASGPPETKPGADPGQVGPWSTP